MGYGLPNYGFFKWIRLHMLPALADTWAPKEKAKKTSLNRLSAVRIS